MDKETLKSPILPLELESKLRDKFNLEVVITGEEMANDEPCCICGNTIILGDMLDIIEYRYLEKGKVKVREYYADQECTSKIFKRYQ